MVESKLKTVRGDMKTLVQDAQALFTEATAAGGIKAEELRTRGMHLLDSALEQVQELQTATLEKGKELADSTDNYVKENPWQAVGLAAAVGVLIGMLIARK
jgi:ElaB/YqjD/DUF883 family membrane-anchored ribosome-binding protein